MGTAEIVVFVVIAFAVLAGAVFAMGRLVHGTAVRPPDGEWVAAPRPWWGHPLVWLGACAIFAVLGLILAPHFFGATFLFLPFLWIGGKRWQPAPRPGCRRCGRAVEPGHAFCPSCGTKVS